MPLTTIAQQLKAECDKLGISALLSSEVLEICISPPRPLVIENCQETVVLSGWPCTAAIYVIFKFSKVRDTLLNCGLSPAGRRPLVCIDECQVNFDSLMSPPAPLIYLLTHTRIDTGVLLGYTYATAVLLGYTHPRTGYIRR